MSSLQIILVGLQLLLAVLVVLIVLFQPSTDEGSFTSSVNTDPNKIFTGVAGLQLVHKITYSFIIVFMINAVILTILFKKDSNIITKRLESTINMQNDKILHDITIKDKKDRKDKKDIKEKKDITNKVPIN